VGRCCHGIYAVVRLGTVVAKVRVASGLLVGFLGMWCHNAIEVGGGLCKLVGGCCG
jgi:hypothetical protein